MGFEIYKHYKKNERKNLIRMMCILQNLEKNLKKNSTVEITTRFDREPAQFWSEKMALRFLKCT